MLCVFANCLCLMWAGLRYLATWGATAISLDALGMPSFGIYAKPGLYDIKLEDPDGTQIFLEQNVEQLNISTYVKANFLGISNVTAARTALGLGISTYRT